MIAKRDVVAEVLEHEGLIDVHTHVGMDPSRWLTGEFPYGATAEDMIVRMDATGVRYAVCMPMGYTSYFALPEFIQGRFVPAGSDLSPAPFEFENQRLCAEVYEAFPDFSRRLLPFAFFDPVRVPRAQVDALEELRGRYPVFGMKTVTSYTQAHITGLLGEGACLLDFAARHDLPVTIHSAVIPGDPWANVFEILRVVEAHPEVRFNIAHTCRFDRRALDRAAALPNCFVDLSAFHIHCKLAVDNHPAVASGEGRFPADYTDHAAAMQHIAEAYPDTMLWGSDIPGHNFMSRFVDEAGTEHRVHLTCEPYREAEEFHRLPDDIQQRIGYRNTIRFLFGEHPSRQAKDQPVRRSWGH